VVDVMCGWFAMTERKMTLILELYAYVARKPDIRHVMTGWMAKSREALERHFSPDVATSLDAIIEGATIHNFMYPEGIPREAARRIVAKLSS
jgi:DNA-binding transcriptional regulator YbjK